MSGHDLPKWPVTIHRNSRSRWAEIRNSQSGARISALLALAHTAEAKGAVLLAHPMGVAAKGFWMKYGHAELLRQAGYHVMLLDLSGFGESTSTTMDYPLDVLAAGQALQAHYPALPIAVLGASMGAAMSLCALAQPDYPFKVAVLESAFPTLLHFWSRYTIPKLGIQLSKLVYPAGERSLRPTYAAHRLVGSPELLLIYGEADKFTPVKDGKLLLQALHGKTSTEFWQVPGAEHTHAYAAQPKEYAEKVIGFLDRHLLEERLAS